MRQRTTKKQSVIDIGRILVASILYALNLNVLVNAGNLIPGGFTGLSLLIQHMFDTFFGIAVPFSIINLLFNAAPAVICYRVIGKKYTLKSILCLIIMSIAVDFLPSFTITNDLLLISIFGGIINGYLLAFILNSHATSGGTDFITMVLTKKYGVTLWNQIFAANVVVLLIAGGIYGMNIALYSIIFQYASTQMINMFYKRYDKDTLFIITKKPEDIYQLIREKTNHDATIFRGVGCFKKEERTMLYSVVNSDATRILVMEIKRKDPGAFVNYFGSKGIKGQFFYQEEE